MHFTHRLCLSSLLLLFLHGTPVNGGEDSSSSQARVGLAIRQLLADRGAVSRDQYDGFWLTVNPISPEEKSALISFANDNLAAITNYQREIWACVERAWRKSAFEKCSNAVPYLDKAAQALPPQARAGLDQAIQNSGRLMHAAAKRSAKVDLADGRTIDLSLEKIQITRNQLDSSADRLRTVLQMEYKP